MIDCFALPLLLQVIAAAPVPGDEEAKVLAPISVTAQRVANHQPASTFASPVTALRFDPQINLQARGLPEAQADITVRGGLFENTGFRLGAVTITDPQTGHYAAEIPIDPAMLSAPELLTDFSNGLNAFNASVATVRYDFARIRSGGSASGGIGTDSLRHGSMRLAHRERLSGGGTLGAAISAAASSGDGTVPFGDHDFSRFSGHLQWLTDERETHLLLGFHDKFAGWPGMYTGIASLPETDRTRLGLAVLDHGWRTTGGQWRIGAAYRWLENDYDFDRRTVETGVPGAFEHETHNASLAVSGTQRTGRLEWHVSGQITADRLVRSTDLTEGRFNSRTFGSLGVAPGWKRTFAGGSRIELRAGLRADLSNRDENALAPMFMLALEHPVSSGLDRFHLEYARTSQLPGYTALNSRPSGLFGGNPDLGREYAGTLSAGWTRESADWTLGATLFGRQDEDLVDWTYRSGAPFVRQANAVDIDVIGFEGLFSWSSERLKLVGGYAWLHKDADYGDAEVDASYYALNFARHRLTLALIFQPIANWELRLDNEYRLQEENPLRSSSDAAYLASASLGWQPAPYPGLRIQLIADNLSDSGFQEFPGTPPMGRQLSLAVALDW
ncbi:MAG: hypothetical protein HKO85_06040 [Xanthomonadales bacterium]|nr:hypothetical protein [Xanthomonadales bacterium]